MCIATRCTTIDQFVEMFHRFVDEDSFFVSTANTRPPGLETSFSVQLADGTPVLRGLCVVLQAWTAPNSPFKTPGVRLGIKRLTASSMPIFERLLVTRSKPPARPPAPVAVAPPPMPRKKPEGTPTELLPSPLPKVIVAEEVRTPGSEYILPANPLQHLTDESLEGYVDCTLYEETANFFPADDDGVDLDPPAPPPPPVAAQPPQPPTFAPRPVAKNPAPIELFADEPPASAEPEPAPMFGDPEPPEVTIESVAQPLPEPSIMEALPAARPTPPPIPIAVTAPAPPPTPARVITRESMPAGELATVPMPIVKARRRRWPLVAGTAALAAATIISISALGSDKSDPSPAAGKQRIVTATAEREPKDDGEPAVVVVPPSGPDTQPPEPVRQPPAKQVPDKVMPEGDDTEEMPAGDSEQHMAGEGPCRIDVASTPAGSLVYLDGNKMAPSPITLATSCGRHKVEIKHPRYQLATKVVTTAENAPGKYEVMMQRPTHTVAFTSQPSGATVFIDGRRAGTTPTSVSVLGFSNLKIEIKKTGYAPVSKRLYSKVPQDKLVQRLTKW